VSPAQQARAENILAENLRRLPQWADPAVAEAHGYHSIGDGSTGDEHYFDWDSINDGYTLDPDHPESLVYRVERGADGKVTKTLEAAMYMLPSGTALDDVPDIGGPLTQWHIHDNLCVTTDPVAPQVADLTGPDGTCPPGQQRFDPRVPMMHVWIIGNECGPFASLEGVGAGQINQGEERACDHTHATRPTQTEATKRFNLRAGRRRGGTCSTRPEGAQEQSRYRVRDLDSPRGAERTSALDRWSGMPGRPARSPSSSVLAAGPARSDAMISFGVLNAIAGARAYFNHSIVCSGSDACVIG